MNVSVNVCILNMYVTSVNHGMLIQITIPIPSSCVNHARSRSRSRVIRDRGRAQVVTQYTTSNSSLILMARSVNNQLKKNNENQ